MPTPKKTKITKQKATKLTNDELLRLLLSKTTIYILLILIMAAFGSYVYLNVWAATP